MPLIAHSIQSAQKSGMFDKIFVSTDSKVYAEIAEEYGVSVPFLRSEVTSGDTAGSWDVVKEVMRHLEEQGEYYDNIMLLQPTSPLRTAEDIINAFALMEEKCANAILSVCEMEHSPLWSNTLPDDLSMDMFRNEQFIIPRQMLPTYYRYNGAIYLLKRSELDKSPMFKEKCYAYIMDKMHSVDIDEEIDFIYAEAIMNMK